MIPQCGSTLSYHQSVDISLIEQSQSVCQSVDISLLDQKGKAIDKTNAEAKGTFGH